MNGTDILTLLWTAVNSPFGYMTAAAVLLWLLNRLYAAKPGWAAYEGTIISAVKFAEKEIPDDVPNKGLARLDSALKYVLKVYEEVNGKRATTQTAATLKEGIQIVHDNLQANGTL
jgi:hypothetical protein